MGKCLTLHSLSGTEVHRAVQKGNNAKVCKKVQKKMTENFASSKFCCNFAELFRHKPEARKNIERFTIDEVVQELNKLSVDSETIQV